MNTNTETVKESEGVNVSLEINAGSEGESPVEPGPAVVVIDSGSGDGALLETVVETAAETAVQEQEIEELQETVSGLVDVVTTQAEATNAIAVEVSEMSAVVTETAVASLDEPIDVDGDGEADIEPDKAPTSARTHWVFRSFREWKDTFSGR